jgi:hypothetical protein
MATKPGLYANINAKQARIKAIQEGTDPFVINDSVIVVEFDNGVRQIMKGKL